MLKFLSSNFLKIVIALSIVVNFSTIESKAASLYDDSYVSLGAGLMFHTFAEKDDFRVPTGAFGTTDEIKYQLGVTLSAELLLNKTLSLELPVGLGLGYKFQTMNGGFEYSILGTTMKRTVDITNHIALVNVYIPLDNEKYWLLGVTGGFGASTYTYNLDFSDATTDVKESSNGYVVPVGVFLDWGADGIGARIGYTYVISNYADIDGITPKGDGSQIYFELRYAI